MQLTDDQVLSKLHGCCLMTAVAMLYQAVAELRAFQCDIFAGLQRAQPKSKTSCLIGPSLTLLVQPYYCLTILRSSARLMSIADFRQYSFVPNAQTCFRLPSLRSSYLGFYWLYQVYKVFLGIIHCKAYSRTLDDLGWCCCCPSILRLWS